MTQEGESLNRELRIRRNSRDEEGLDSKKDKHPEVER